MSLVGSLYLFDVASFVLIVVTAYLSKRLGDALKVPAYYLIMYVAASVLVASMCVDLFTDIPVFVYGVPLHTILLGIRFLCALIALLIAVRYWYWLLIESLKK